MAIERPILLSTPMVKAVLQGTKTQTRRANGLGIINKDPSDWKFNWMDYQTGWCFNQISTLTKKRVKDKTFNQVIIKCPYGIAEDVLWVRETFANGYNGVLDENLGKDEKDFTLKYWIFKDGSQIFSNGEYFQRTDISDDAVKTVMWKPSIHMPKEAARIWLKIEFIRVERLQSITEEDAIAEGVGSGFQMNAGWPDYQHISKSGVCELTQDTAQMSYASLWDLINSEKYPWDFNPWVWVIGFKQIARPK